MEYNKQWSKEALQMKFWDLNWEFSVRLERALKDNFPIDITLEKMRDTDNKELLKCKNFGKSSLYEFRCEVGDPNIPTCPSCHRILE